MFVKTTILFLQCSIKKYACYVLHTITSPSGKLLPFRHCKPQLSGWLMNNNDPTLRESKVNYTCCSYCCLHWPCKNIAKTCADKCNYILSMHFSLVSIVSRWVLFSIYQQEVVGSVSCTDMEEVGECTPPFPPCLTFPHLHYNGIASN